MARNARTTLLVSGALLLAAGGLALSVKGASAEETGNAANPTPTGTLSLDVSQAMEAPARINLLNPYESPFSGPGESGLELELAAPGAMTGMPVDLSFSQRAAFEAGNQGDISGHTSGAEVRVGRALGDPGGAGRDTRARVYVFAASDDEALTWQPGQQSSNFALQQDRVEIGDRQAGITYERGDMQASLAYVEREVSATIGQTTHSNDENFAGLTLTMRR
jgi:hypothetical protein